MKKNKKKLFFPLFLAGSFILAGCSTSTVVARPSWIDESIIENITTKDNTMKLIYDAIKALGTTNSSLLNKVLYEISFKKIGNYVDDEKNSIKGLATIASYNYGENRDEIKKFVEKYPIYQTKETKGYYRETREGNPIEYTLTEDQKLDISLGLIKDVYKMIEDSVYESLYNEIKGGTYSVGKVKKFSETKYIYNLYKNMHTSKTAEEFQESVFNNKITFTQGYDDESGTFTYKNESTPWADAVECKYNETKRISTSGFLTIKTDANGVYQKNMNIFDSIIYGQYIKDKIIPEVYRNLLIQNYIKDQRYSTLGRSYARKVNVISYTASDDDTKTRIINIFKTFAEKHIYKKDTTLQGDYTYEELANVIRGFIKTSTPTDYTDKLVRLTVKNQDGNDVVATFKSSIDTKTTYTVYKGTKLGDLVEKLNKVANPNASGTWTTLRRNYDVSELNTLTNSGEYSLAEAIEIKEREIAATNLVKDGWYLKSKLTDITDTVKNRLFNISTSATVDNHEKAIGDTTHFDYTTDYARYFQYTKSGTQYSKCFATNKDTSLGTSATDSIVLNEADSKVISIVEIQDAVSTSKLSDISTNNYAHLKAAVSTSETDSNRTASVRDMHTITNDIAKIHAADDTYKKNANQYYLMISNIVFHDQSVYDYFKSQFPDLFK